MSEVGEPHKTKFWDVATSFGTRPLLGHVFRMYASAPEFKNPDHCWTYGEGASILLLPGGGGRLLISKHAGGATRHATIPLQLKGYDFAVQPRLGIELRQFWDRCEIHGEGSDSAQEARRIVNDFDCDLLDPGMSTGWELKLYPCLGGHTFRYGSNDLGEEETTLAQDVMLTTPNCDELGHYLFRTTGDIVSEDTLEAALAGEVAAWNAILAIPPIAVGDRVRVRHGFESASEGGGTLLPGLVGTVKAIDEQGDAEVAFDGDCTHWVFVANFRNLCREPP